MESAETAPASLDIGDRLVAAWTVAYAALMLTPVAWMCAGPLADAARLAARVLRFVY